MVLYLLEQAWRTAWRLQVWQGDKCPRASPAIQVPVAGRQQTLGTSAKALARLGL